jgi:secreted PhoX family phosphatase
VALTRRQLLTHTAIGAGALAVGNVGSLLAASPASAAGSVGDPVPDPAGVLDLPARFAYRIVSRAGDPLPGGGATPGRHDGTAAFVGPNGGLRLVQNHEIGSSDPNPTLAVPELTYDPKAKGGTTTLTLDRSRTRVDEYVSLAGTWSNCAGGLTPWGTWLTCEETEQRAGASADKDHGFVFEVDPADPAHNTNPTPLTALGRFAHEAVCVDPQRGDLYLTEDASGPNGLVYRFQPTDRHRSYGALRNGGTLTAMSCRQGTSHVNDLSVFTAPGTTLQVDWVAVPDPQAATLSIRKQLADAQVTRSRKLEGVWWGDATVDGFLGALLKQLFGRRREDIAHIVCSFARISDGSLAEHDGQVWGYDPDRQTLTLELYLPLNTDAASDTPDGPDNICVSPYGGFFLAEDGVGAQHLLAVDERANVRPFARNRMSGSEFTGVSFAPDGQTLFANIQDEGLCFAITGPFQKLR